MKEREPANLWDYQLPDIVWGDEIPKEIAWHNGEPAFETRDGRRFVVHARRTTWPGWIGSVPVWECIHPYVPQRPHPTDTGRCRYSIGEELTMPLPGQRCHQCGGLRAEWISQEDA